MKPCIYLISPVRTQASRDLSRYSSESAHGVNIRHETVQKSAVTAYRLRISKVLLPNSTSMTPMRRIGTARQNGGEPKMEAGAAMQEHRYSASNRNTGMARRAFCIPALTNCAELCS